MILVRPYYLTDHLSLIRHWLRLRDISESWADDLPEVGFIAFDRNDGIAAGFLRRIERDHAFIDGLITNPLSEGRYRNTGIDLVVANLIEKARELRLKSILAYSEDAGTLKRSERFGFQKLPHVLISKEL